MDENSLKSRRLRTAFQQYQLRALKSFFVVNQKPDSNEIRQLEKATGLSFRVLQVWFQNARAKWRKYSGSTLTSPSSSEERTQTQSNQSAVYSPTHPSPHVGHQLSLPATLENFGVPQSSNYFQYPHFRK